MEKIKTFTIDEVENRMKEIRALNLDEVSNIDELTKEVEALEQRQSELKAETEAKRELRNKILNGDVETKEIEKTKEYRNMEFTKENYLSSKEYRSAFLKKLQGKELSEVETRAYAMSGADAIVPESMQKDILSKVKEYAPILQDITLLHVNGAVKFAVEGTNTSADVHAENATISGASDTMVEVVLSAYEITKLIQISASVKAMSIDSFEAWLVDMLVEAIAMKVEALIFNGTGSAQPKGINATTWNATNSISVAKASATTAQNIYDLFALLKSGYKAKAYMNRTTLFADLLPLRDSSKHELVTREGDRYFLLGAPIELTDSVNAHEILLGDSKKVVANLAEEIGVKSAYDINTNSYKYLGVAVFDAKLAIEEAFVKLVKASS